MASLQELQQVRLNKLALLRQARMDPFTARVDSTHTIAQVLAGFESIESEQGTVTITGRIMGIRGQGGILFASLFDGTDTIQAVFKKDTLSEELFTLFVDAIDIADFITVTGTVFVTTRGERSVLANSWQIATKSLLPLPDKWHGLVDDDIRYRKRYLDILTDAQLRSILEVKSRFWQATRQYLLAAGFLEVETPTLETTTGGAEARPFRTHHNDYDIDVYLRISVGELWQKRLMAAGFPATFEIGRVYRNEGSSPEHLQEFTNLEFYIAYRDYQWGMQFTEAMLKHIVRESFGSTIFTIKGQEVDIAIPWPVIEYVPYIQEQTGVNVLEASTAQLEAKLHELGVSYEGTNRERLTDTLWKYCRKQIVGPVWLIHHPKLVSPLSKSCVDAPELTERCNLILGGAEVFNGFSELNDPIDQRARFAEQQKLLAAGDDEAMMPDWEFVEMLEHGMPPTFGFGMGMDRLFAILVGKPIRETQLFPLMRPLSE